MSNPLRVKTRLKSRNYFSGVPRHKAKSQFSFSNRTIEEFLKEHSINDYIYAVEGQITLKRLNLLAELAYLLRSSTSTQINDAIFREIFKRSFLCLLDGDYRVRTLSIQITRFLALTNSRFMLILEHFGIIILRSLHMIELPEVELLECLKLVVKIFNYYYNAESSYKKLICSNEHFRLFFRYSLKCLLSLAFCEYDSHNKKQSINEDLVSEEIIYSSRRFSIPAIGIFLEAAVQEPFLIVEYFGTNWFLQCFDTFCLVNARLTFIMHQILTKWLDSPRLRECAELSLVLQKVSAPLIDLGFFQRQTKEINNQKVVEGLESSAQAFYDIMQTWSGLFSCIATATHGHLHDFSPLKIISFFGLGELTGNAVKLRDVIVNTCCDFVCAPYARKNFSSWNEAVSFYSELHLPDNYKCSLRDDFVVGEMTALMANGDLFYDETDLLFCFHSAAAFSLIEAGIIEALHHFIIASPDDQISVKATLLLFDILCLGTTYLPREKRYQIMAVPELIRSAAENYFQHSASRFFANTDFTHYCNYGACLDDGLEKRHCNSFILFNRIDQLNESTRMRDSTPLLNQLHNINIFLLNSSDNQFNLFAVEKDSPTKSVESELFALEQCFSNVPNNLFLNESNNNFMPTPPISDPERSLLISAEDWLGEMFDETEIEKLRKLLPINWRFVDQFLQTLEATRISVISEILNRSSKFMDKYRSFFLTICNQFLPSKQLFARNFAQSSNFDVLHTMNCGRRTFNFVSQQLRLTNSIIVNDEASSPHSPTSYNAELTIFGVEETFYVDLIEKFASDFCTELSKKNTYTGTFSSKNVLNGNALYYFAIVRIISQHEAGYKILERIGLFQIFFDLLLNNSESIEYAKLILSSLNYSNDGISRVILRTAATSSEKRVRKWTTRFLNILIGLNDSQKDSLQIWRPANRAASSDDRETKSVAQFALRLAICQLSDESPKVIRHALQLLIRWLPHKLEHLHLLKSINFRLYGNMGRVLEGIYFGLFSVEHSSRNEILDYWMTEFNEKYVEILEEEMRRLNLNVKRTLSGHFARPSNVKTGRRVLRALPHFLGNLARRDEGRRLLVEKNVLKTLIKKMRHFLQCRQSTFGDTNNATPLNDVESGNYLAEESENRHIKGTILAAGQIVRGYDEEAPKKDSVLLEQALLLIVEFASKSEWLSVRGCALWALNIAGCGQYGAKLLTKIGWECGSRDEHLTTVSHLESDQTLLKRHSKFICGDYLTLKSRRDAPHVRRRSYSDSCVNTVIDCTESHFLHKTVSQRLHYDSGMYDRIDSTNSTTQEPITETRRSEEHVGEKYLFLTEQEQAHLISYRNLMAAYGSDESEQIDKAKSTPNQIVFLKTPSHQESGKKRLPIIFLPYHTKVFCSNVFTKSFPTPLNRSASTKNYFNHHSIYCLHCTAINQSDASWLPIANVSSETLEAYKKYGEEVLHLIHRIEICLAELDKSEAISKFESGSEEEEDKSSESVADDNLKRTNSAVSIHTRLLWIYANAPSVFEHPCLFSDVLYAMADSRLNASNRRFIHQLFWNAQL